MLKKKFSLEDQRSHCFQYYENLQSILKDLAFIDKLIPGEVSRYAPASLVSERDALIQGRKHDLLKYIQTICRDHLLYSKRLMDSGNKNAPWEPGPRKKRLHGGTQPHSREERVGWKD